MNRPATSVQRWDAGSGTVLATLVIAAIFAAGFLLSALALAHQSRWRVQTAVDMAALAAAGAWRSGLEPCQIAIDALQRNSAALRDCELRPGGQVKISGVIEVNLLGTHQVVGNALAGPRPPP